MRQIHPLDAPRTATRESVPTLRVLALVSCVLAVVLMAYGHDGVVNTRQPSIFNMAEFTGGMTLIRDGFPNEHIPGVYFESFEATEQFEERSHIIVPASLTGGFQGNAEVTITAIPRGLHIYTGELTLILHPYSDAVGAGYTAAEGQSATSTGVRVYISPWLVPGVTEIRFEKPQGP